MNNQTSPHRRADLLLGAILMLVGIIAGVLLAGNGQQAMAQQRINTDRVSDALPAITLSDNDFALVKGNSGFYYLVNRSGQAEAVRFRDATLRTVPSESLLFVP